MGRGLGRQTDRRMKRDTQREGDSGRGRCREPMFADQSGHSTLPVVGAVSHAQRWSRGDCRKEAHLCPVEAKRVGCRSAEVVHATRGKLPRAPKQIDGL